MSFARCRRPGNPSYSRLSLLGQGRCIVSVWCIASSFTILFLFPTVLFAQSRIVSPTDSAIIQLRNNRGELHFVAELDARATAFQFRITDSLGDALTGFDWQTIQLHSHFIDTIVWLPVIKNLRVEWLTNASANDSGAVGGLAVGHIFGIVGQSNAQGWTGMPYVLRTGDARMMSRTFRWSQAEDPTGDKWGSPWIAFVNKLQLLLHDSLPIGIINAAIGGSGLTVVGDGGIWQRTEENYLDTNSIYGAALMRFQAAGSDLEAMFWIQGESDAIGTTVAKYQQAFARLHSDFEQDLKFQVRFFHEQIGGQRYNPGRTTWGIVREALRTLPGSTLVSSTVGLPVSQVDGIHYSPNTARVVGERFAGAVADVLYGIKTSLYPPPLPGTPRLVQCTARDGHEGWKIEVPCLKAGVPVRMSGMGSIRGFQLSLDAVLLDTSLVVAQINPTDSSCIDLFISDRLIEPSPTWRVSYAITGDISNVSLCDGDTLSTPLPNMLVAFLTLPVYDSLFSASVQKDLSGTKNAKALGVIPNPATTQTVIPFRVHASADVRYAVYDALGRTIVDRALGHLPSGIQQIELDCHTWHSGIYWAVLQIGETTQRLKFEVVR